MEAVASEYGYGKIEDLHAALGYGKFSARQVLQKLAPDKVQMEQPPEPAAKPVAADRHPPRAPIRSPAPMAISSSK